MVGTDVKTPGTASHVRTSLANTLASLEYRCGANAKSLMALPIFTGSVDLERKSLQSSLICGLFAINRATLCFFSTSCKMISFKKGSAFHGRLSNL